MICVDIWSGPFSQFHVARYYNQTVEESLGLISSALEKGDLVNVLKVKDTVDLSDVFDTRDCPFPEIAGNSIQDYIDSGFCGKDIINNE